MLLRKIARYRRRPHLFPPCANSPSRKNNLTAPRASHIRSTAHLYVWKDIKVGRGRFFSTMSLHWSHRLIRIVQKVVTEASTRDNMRSILVQNFLVWLTRPKLVRAAKKGNRAEIQRLLSSGIQVDVADRYGRTALMEACRIGHHEAVKLMLHYGADPYKKSFSGKDSFGYSLSREVTRTLRAHAEAMDNKLPSGKVRRKIS
jgi:hypothetical protein